jgi:ribosomal protein S18 acetylase RimI-like enzyme
MEYKIRKAKLEDCKILDGMLNKDILEEIKYDKNSKDEGMSKKFYEKFFDVEGAITIVAEDTNKNIVGYIYGQASHEYMTLKPVAKLRSLYVEADHRKNGIGNKLVNEFKELAKENNCKYVEVSALKNNFNSNKLYLKSNFTENIIVYRCEI